MVIVEQLHAACRLMDRLIDVNLIGRSFGGAAGVSTGLPQVILSCYT